jgi:hypothetical protein
MAAMRLAVIAGGVVAAVALAVVGIAWSTGVFDAGEAEPAQAATSSPPTGTFPEGVYRYRLTKPEVRALVPTIEPALLEDAVGTFTWTIRNGTISLHQTDCSCSFTRISAPYRATARLFTVYWPKRADNGVEFCANDCVETVAWKFDGRALHFMPLATAGYDLVFWGAHKPWVKID